MDEWFDRSLEDVDPEIAQAVSSEMQRQEGINLIASESLASKAVREASASVLTNKYAEGYPHKRYYGGCEHVDVAEDLALKRAKQLFKCDHVNVQPHCGTQANQAVYLSCLDPGDTILSMQLSHGGHLSHGYRVNFSGKIYHGEFYTVNRDTGVLDYNEVLERAKQVKPKLIVCGYSAYPRTVPFKEFAEISEQVDALLLADIAHIAGLVASEAHPSPIGYADYVTTTTHKTLMGPRGAMVMCRGEHAEKIDKAVFPGTQGGPFMHLIAAKAVCFKENLSKQRRALNHKVVENAKALAESLLDEGFDLVSGGTDNHLVLADLSSKDVTGKDAESALQDAGITLNKNTVPYDKQKPFVTSGIRLGSPCVTIRGMGEEEMKKIGGWISDVVSNLGDSKIRQRIRGEVSDLCARFPVYK